MNTTITLSKGHSNSVLDTDGSAVHASADDYKSDPAGNAGARIACGVITE
jgi:Cu-Zn family superoxide dismutase